MAEYPVKNIDCLGIKESDSFQKAMWDNPQITEYGLELLDHTVYAKYTENFFELKDKLKNYVPKYSNIFTHNPWGEYGHEDHVQVYRVLSELAQETKFNLWLPNYYSHQSVNLARQYHIPQAADYVSFKTNKLLAGRIKELYSRNKCWTWYPDWEWYDEESFCNNINIHRQTANVETSSNLTWLRLIEMAH